MSNEDKDNMLAQFQSITGLDDAGRASFFLEASNWNVDLAISSFFDDPAGAIAPEESMEAREPSTSEENMDTSGEREKPSGRGGVSFGTRADLDEAGSASDKSDTDDDAGQAFYAGGGQQIVGPSKKKAGADLVKEMFKKAKESGAETVDPSSKAASSSGSTAFVGAGYKLGSSEGAPAEMVSGATKPKEPKQFIIKMWKDGFSINEDGELRPYNDPTNRSFLASVMSGRIPTELQKVAENGEVHVDLEDHKEEEYQKPKGASSIKAFSGTGHTLGGITPAVASDPLPNIVSDTADLEQKAQDELNVDGTQGVATVQIRLHDGKTLKVKLNHSHTVGDLRRFVTTARPDLSNRPFALRTSFPSKELEKDDDNIKDAGLIGAAILLRLQ